MRCLRNKVFVNLEVEVAVEDSTVWFRDPKFEFLPKLNPKVPCTLSNYVPWNAVTLNIVNVNLTLGKRAVLILLSWSMLLFWEWPSFVTYFLAFVRSSLPFFNSWSALFPSSIAPCFVLRSTVLSCGMIKRTNSTS